MLTGICSARYVQIGWHLKVPNPERGEDSISEHTVKWKVIGSLQRSDFDSDDNSTN